jgi:hypothetical protein
MTQIVIEGINPAIFEEIERRARQAGTSVQAAASQILEKAVAQGVLPGEKGVGVAADPTATRARQAALAAEHPDEYVVLSDERVLLHTSDKAEAFTRYEEALEQPGDEARIVVPPRASRQLPKPVFRGRALAGTRRS